MRKRLSPSGIGSPRRPWGCGSKRCRRRPWSWCAGFTRQTNRGDFTAVFAAYDPEIEWHVLGVAELGFDPVYVGHDGVRTFWRLWLSAWETTSFEYDEFIDAGEHVVVVQSQRMRGRTSGIELEWNSYAQVWTIQDAKVVRMEFFPTRGGALEAVGLSE
jgi:ketosteroid isomerase-like protein